MKRDVDLLRKVVQFIEPQEQGDLFDIEIEGYALDEVKFHCRLLEESQLVEEAIISDFPHCDRLTWKGYEFLEASRNDELWKNAKELVMQTTGGMAFVLLMDVLIKLAQQAISEKLKH